MEKLGGVWDRIWASAQKIGTFWLEVRPGGDGPMADLPNGETTIFYEPWPPYDRGECEVEVRKAEYCYIGKWTGKTRK